MKSLKVPALVVFVAVALVVVACGSDNDSSGPSANVAPQNNVPTNPSEAEDQRIDQQIDRVKNICDQHGDWPVCAFTVVKDPNIDCNNGQYNPFCYENGYATTRQYRTYKNQCYADAVKATIYFYGQCNF